MMSEGASMEAVTTINVEELITEAMKISQVAANHITMFYIFRLRMPVEQLIRFSMLKSKLEW